MNILLLDVDNVLINPIAYSGCIDKTIKTFFKKRGSMSFPPNEKIKNLFISQGVHDVWDIASICIALQVTDNFISESNNILYKPKKQDYEGLIKKVDYLKYKDVYPPLLTFDYLIKKAKIETRRKNFSSLEKTLHDILDNTRDIYKNSITKLFQELLLGDRLFYRTYGIKTSIKGKSLLQKEDRPLINNAGRRSLASIKGKGAKIAIYTARPSLSPFKKMRGYSPEAETAIKMCKIKYPYIGMGSMEWLAKKKGENIEDLTKPDHTQALAAIAVSINDNQKIALESAYSFSKKGKIKYPLDKIKNSTIYVFEDSPSGIRAVEKAAEAFPKYANIKFVALGVHGNSSSKKKSLQKVCEKTFPDINSALKYCSNSL